MKKKVLLLTGTISPRNTPNLARCNVEDRENDYYLAISAWLTHGLPIVFCENSNYDSPKISALLENRIDCEYIKFETKVSHLGKSNGEAEIIEYAMNNSFLISQSSIIVKVTGRYNISNFATIIKSVSDSVNICANLTQNLTWADSRFFIFSHTFFKNHLSSFFLVINEAEGRFFEHSLSRAINSALANQETFKLLPHLPIIIGVYGTDNEPYRISYFKKKKYYLYGLIKKYCFENTI